jgi:hypothetical protein
LLRQYLAVIHDEFQILYHAQGNATFAMDIEYKIGANNQLVIKQARPWVSYVPTRPYPFRLLDCSFVVFPNPATDVITVGCADCGLVTIRITDLSGRTVSETTVDITTAPNPQIDVSHLAQGTYVVSGIIVNNVCGSFKFVKQ